MTPAGHAAGTAPASALLASCRADWLAGRWPALLALPAERAQADPACAEIAALQAAAAARSGDREAALTHAQRARDAGGSPAEVARLLLAGAWDSLARAAWVAMQPAIAAAAFDAAVAPLATSPEDRQAALLARQAGAEQAWQQLLARPPQRKGLDAASTTAVPSWLQRLADQCLASEDLHDEADRLLDDVLQGPEDRVRLRIALADRLRERGDSMSALHFLRSARWLAGEVSPALRRLLARRLVAANAGDTALDITVESALADPRLADTDTAVRMQASFHTLRQLADRRASHGHVLLLDDLGQHVEHFKALAGGRQLTVIEIGTTREDVPGQGSTRLLAEFCKRHGLAFVTVDMDPHNARMARDTFRRLGVPQFEAVTGKGEDYLSSLPAPIDFVFLDAYDYDHGKHSELRQARYEKFLGSRIDEEACHAMHLDCARSLVAKLWEHGRICLDDTWLEDGRWTAKGTTAMPYLLAQGFEVVCAQNRAALLRRPPAGEAGA